MLPFAFDPEPVPRVSRASGDPALPPAVEDPSRPPAAGLCWRAACGVAPLVPTAGCVGGVVGLAVDVAPPTAGWVGGAPVASAWAAAEKDASARQAACSVLVIANMACLLELDRFIWRVERTHAVRSRLRFLSEGTYSAMLANGSARDLEKTVPRGARRHRAHACASRARVTAGRSTSTCRVHGWPRSMGFRGLVDALPQGPEAPSIRSRRSGRTLGGWFAQRLRCAAGESELAQ
jgi:hypothetical protein